MDAEGIAEFLAVARSGSFTAAARSLGVSVPHVSRQVRRFEARLGIKVFHRSTRSVRLTEAGDRLQRDCEKIALELDQALDDLSLEADAGEGIVEPDLEIATDLALLEDEIAPIDDDITLIRCGGHFPGSTVLHWAKGADGKGVLLTGDTIMVVSDRRYVTFMYSYPNCQRTNN